MNRYKYKDYWVEIFIERDELQNYEDQLYYAASIELPNQGGVETTANKWATIQDCSRAAERLIDLLDASN